VKTDPNNEIKEACPEANFNITYEADSGVIRADDTLNMGLKEADPEGTAAAQIASDKVDYGPEEVVTIMGYGFQPNVEVNVEVIKPDGYLDLWTLSSDGEGAFITTYQLDATEGLYFIKVYDGIDGTETKFMITSQTAIPEPIVISRVATDRVEYNPEEVVTIMGYGFQPNATVNVEVMRPDGTFDSWNVNSDEAGVFCHNLPIE